MADAQDVTPESSPGPTETPPAQEPVTPVAGDDRPVQNVVAEMNRKFGQMHRQIESLTQFVATLQTARPEAAPAQSVSDDDLWRLAQQGDRGAFDLYMQRRATQAAQTQVHASRMEQVIDAQLAALAQKYPVLNDQSHPLAQTVQAAYSLLCGQGYPTGKRTLLEAIKTSIADRPDLVAQLYSSAAVAQEGARRSATHVAQAGQTGASHRASAPPAAKTRPISSEEAALARRMGIADPAKSKERFLKRQEAGQSQLGAVAGFVREEDL